MAILAGNICGNGAFKKIKKIVLFFFFHPKKKMDNLISSQKIINSFLEETPTFQLSEFISKKTDELVELIY